MENLVSDKTFWKGKKVLISGHTGFKGSWLSLWLQTKGADVIGYALPPPTKPSLFELANLSESMDSVIGDIRDLGRLNTAVEKYRPEIVFHMAAQALVRSSYKDPVETFGTNVMGTVNMLEVARLSDSVKVAVIITSDKCYRNEEWVWGYRETDPMGGHDPYSCSKGCAELVTAAYSKSFFGPAEKGDCKVHVASTRAGNVIGGGDWACDRLIPDIVRSIMKDQPVFIRYPNAIRPWQFVLEPLRGYLTLAERLWNEGDAFAGAWNFGPDEEGARPVSWVVERLTGLWGQNARWETDSKGHPHEATYLRLDCSKARAYLRWKPILPLEQSLEWVAEWYKSYSEDQNMLKLSKSQLEKYEGLILP